MAGRTQGKLDTLVRALAGCKTPPSAAFLVDHADTQKVADLVGRARVAINYAGPFARYGEAVIAACASLGTHYLDITGETVWVSDMMQRYATVAEQSGAILIPFAGFDSVPSDVGAWRVTQQARQSSTYPVTRVINLVSARGGFNGGTYQTFLDTLALSDADLKRHNDPALLVPPASRAHFHVGPLLRPVYVPEEKLLAPPFFMEPINSRVVYRSQALRGVSHDAPPFEYSS